MHSSHSFLPLGYLSNKDALWLLESLGVSIIAAKFKLLSWFWTLCTKPRGLSRSHRRTNLQRQPLALGRSYTMGWLTFWLYNNIYIIEVFLFVNKVGVLKKALAWQALLRTERSDEVVFVPVAYLYTAEQPLLPLHEGSQAVASGES